MVPKGSGIAARVHLGYLLLGGTIYSVSRHQGSKTSIRASNSPTERWTGQGPADLRMSQEILK